MVIGGGHAGAEAAWAAARLGARTALVTLSRATIGQMSCNPAIGGIGKGQIVREIDALGGLMGLAADATGIQFRMLNRSKGPAVWGPRCQSDRHAYAEFVRTALEATPGLTIIEGEVVDIAVQHRQVCGVVVRDPLGALCTIPCRAVIVTAGTFLRGLLHCGPRTWPGGRYDEPAAADLSAALARLGIRLERLKTGTCPRVAADSIDYARCTRQDGDQSPVPFSFLHDRLDIEQVPCWITQTNPAVHQIIRDNFHRAPMFTGQISAAGPRYCPSLETKIDRFADKDSHLVFLEPEGRGPPTAIHGGWGPRGTEWVYLNGLSTSLPPDVQEAVLRGIAGLANARVLRWGYAIEYDFAPPTQLRPSLMTKAVEGLFLAGQVNGTTGYEEAAAQGLIAGVNAARHLAGREGLVLRRDQAYIGVMIDDLVTKGVLEPYRMFTSRAEYRLLLRADNADRRLTPLGRQIGLVDERRWRRFEADLAAGARAAELLRSTRRGGRSIIEALGNPQLSLDQAIAGEEPPLAELRRLRAEHPRPVESAATDCRYAGYLAKDLAAAARLQDLEARRIPPQLDYAVVPHLRAEARQRLSEIRPETLAQALRVSGITPADITVLSVHLMTRR